MIKRALLSVWHKDGLVDLAKFLINNGVELISTGGTQRVLEDAGLSVKSVSDITGSEAVMDGRVKTLDPKIFGGILADRGNPSHMDDLAALGAGTIDLVVVNFYPFVSKAVENKLEFKKAIEFIDIGGPSMIRAAAKNFHSVVPLCSPDLYPVFMDHFKQNDGEIPLNIRQSFAARVFKLTAEYETAIADYFAATASMKDQLTLRYHKSAELRYGENPHQKASFYLPVGTELPWTQHQGKALSYNNYSDMESAYSIAGEFHRTGCSIVKHANPCGFGLAETPLKAYLKSVQTDPTSYFGGIVGFNCEVDAETAQELNKSFLECIIAPLFSEDALATFKKKKNLRIVTVSENQIHNPFTMKSVAGGILYQDRDIDQGELEKLTTVTRRSPDPAEYNALELGWKLVRFVKSNAIVFSSEDQLLGVGAGQMSRVDSVKLAISKARDAGLSLDGAAMASDAFFPFPDGIEFAAEAGIRSIIQPGGSINDKEVIKRADELGITMVFTGIRHFYH